MTGQQAFAELMARRRAATDRTALDAAIHARFGTRQAVLFTDLVGFSRLVEAFGILHFLQLIHESESLFLPTISAHGGTCLKHEGDSLMAVFDTPQQALATARAMVAATRRVNPGRAPEERIEVCIGLGYGDVLRIDGDVWGSEVNAASRLGEDTARGGEILVTQGVRDALPQEPFAPHGVLFGTRPVYRWAGPGA
ncbi:MAG: adenylate/guanylate cyclase domain-containing protein [Rhodoferax sp.]|jgi:adenylate cyclase|nr:adenylate/guanylate cyclase domain-containing protein [Rhodoferax sp.]